MKYGAWMRLPCSRPCMSVMADDDGVDPAVLDLGLELLDGQRGARSGVVHHAVTSRVVGPTLPRRAGPRGTKRRAVTV